MKTAKLVLLIAGYVLMHGVDYAAASNPAPQQSLQNSATAGSDHSNDAEHATPASEGKGQKEATALDKRRDSRHISHKILSRSPARLTKPNHPKKIQNNHEPSRPENVMNVQQARLAKAVSGASQIANHRTSPIRPVTDSAISGQQFRNGRNPGATPVVIGGPAAATRSTAAINGTTIIRRHVN